jgi:hypothetical protein
LRENKTDLDEYKEKDNNSHMINEAYSFKVESDRNYKETNNHIEKKYKELIVQNNELMATVDILKNYIKYEQVI